MAKYTQEEYRLARDVNILDYLQAAGYELQKSGQDWQLREHNSLKISKDGKWYWYSRNTGGSSPIELLRQLKEDSNSIAAIKELASYAKGNGAGAFSEEKKAEEMEQVDKKTEEKSEFQLPEQNITSKRAFAYLKDTRKIDEEIISACMAAGLIYESKQYHNAVFVGQKDEAGQVRHASLRGTYTNAAKPFKGDVTGADKSYSFALEGKPESKKLYICESAIDVLSHASMTKLDADGDWRQDHRLALGGMSQTSLDLYLQHHPQISQITFCLDNDIDGKDKAGNPHNHGQIRAAALISEYKAKGYLVENYLTSSKDLNDELKLRKGRVKSTHGKETEVSILEPSLPDADDDIMKRLEAGVKDVFSSQKYLQYLKVMSKFHKYSVNNLILIMLQRPDATMVAGYQAWQKKFSRSVMAGEKGLRILAPRVKKEKQLVDVLDRNTGEKQSTEKDIEKIVGYRTVTVFDVAQTQGKELPQLTSELNQSVTIYEELMAALRVISTVPISLKQISSGAKGFYSPADKAITIQEGMGQLQTVKTAIHELAHSRLHKELTVQETLSKNEIETQAESVAFVVCNHFGLDTSDYSFPYLASWSSGKNVEELRSSLAVIRKEASKIIDELTTEMENQRDNQLVKSNESSIPLSLEEAQIALAADIMVYDLNGELIQNTEQPMMVRISDLESGKEKLPKVYDRYLLQLFREGFEKNPIQTLDVFGVTVHDSDFNQILLLKDPFMQNKVQEAESLSDCVKMIQQQLTLGNGIAGKVKVQLNWSETDLPSGGFYSLLAANKIFGEYEKCAREDGSREETQFALYVESSKNQWRYGESRFEFGSEFADNLMDFIAKTMPLEIVDMCEKTLRAQEKNLSQKTEKEGQKQKKKGNRWSR